jgi:hypothetical protein
VRSNQIPAIAMPSATAAIVAIAGRDNPDCGGTVLMREDQ